MITQSPIPPAGPRESAEGPGPEKFFASIKLCFADSDQLCSNYPKFVMNFHRHPQGASWGKDDLSSSLLKLSLTVFQYTEDSLTVFECTKHS